MLDYKSLTIKYNGITNTIASKCRICEAFDPRIVKNGGAHPIIRECKGIWDTGASKSSISNRVVEELGLEPIGQGINNTAAGSVQTNLYLINMYLPFKVVIPFLTVTSGDLGDIDILIGMDVIARGDFSVTNADGKTTFSFRMPSLETIDYVKQKPRPVDPIVRGKEPGRNDPCPCGSGKKYKNCCGKK